jgi:bifunctional DNA-binding transcriptional regulator/antitoxin component of YhaV-PrlF toxin-antitoxin module
MTLRGTLRRHSSVTAIRPRAGEVTVGDIAEEVNNCELNLERSYSHAGLQMLLEAKYSKIVLPCRPGFQPRARLSFPPIRRKLGLRTGDPLDAKVEGGRIVLTPRRTRSRKVSILRDPITGLPVLSGGPDAPALISKQVQEILSEYP